MMKILYISNIEVPYKVRMFNELAQYCDLTVLYERSKSSNRNSNWAYSEKPLYNIEYLDGINVGNEYSFSFRILSKLFSEYDGIFISCYNSPVQMLAILVMRLFKKPYILSIDGEIFLQGNLIKKWIKKFFLRGADAYLAAGTKSAESLKAVAGKKRVEPYYFSSLSKAELEKNALSAYKDRDNKVLVVGQYYDYKGLDIVVKAARLDSSIKYKIVGTGNRTNLFERDQEVAELNNIEVIPFLSKKELEKEYQNCAMLVLPSRQECWGLVINEAASFGMPIVSTWGSGAAVEFLADRYPCCLAEPDNAEQLLKGIKNILAEDCTEYSAYLLQKSQNYNIEEIAKIHMKIFMN